jgi:hypothetical protein
MHFVFLNIKLNFLLIIFQEFQYHRVLHVFWKEQNFMRKLFYSLFFIKHLKIILFIRLQLFILKIVELLIYQRIINLSVKNLDFIKLYKY